MKILFIGHAYHCITKSSRFFIDWLGRVGEVTTVFDHCKKGVLDNDYRDLVEGYDMVVVWQMHQVIRQLVNQERRTVIYVPMYDAVHKLDGNFWKSLNNIKVICFSAAIRATCFSHGLDSFFIQYYPESADEAAIGYDQKCIFFWQRRRWPNWQTLVSILPTTQFDRLHYHIALDPGVEVEPKSDIRPTPSEFLHLNLQTSRWFDDKNDLLRVLDGFNLFFLPREREGIGFSFLDSMERGMIPIGFNQATFNEYVIHGINGFIVDKNERLDLPDLSPVAVGMRHHLVKGRNNYLRSLDLLADFILAPSDSDNHGGSWVQKLLRKPGRRVRQDTASKAIASRGPFEGSTPLVSVIMVVGEDGTDFVKSHRSICAQSYRNFEYILIDRGAAGKERSLIESAVGTFDRNEIVRGGIGDAMMKGASVARGRYVIFINCGDEFAESTSLEDAMDSAPGDADILYGHHYLVKREASVELRIIPDFRATCEGLREGGVPLDSPDKTLCPQAVLMCRRLISDIGIGGFDKGANFDLLFSAYIKGAEFYHTNTIIAKCRSSGAGKEKAGRV